jgi:argininosuccinate lyase
MRSVEFDFERMRKSAQSGFMNAWAAATYLVKRGVPFRLAHEQIGRAVQMAEANHSELEDLPLEELRQLNPLFDEDFFSCLKLQSVIDMHDVPGGTASARVRQAIADARQRVHALRENVHAHA